MEICFSFERVIKKIRKLFRERVFYERTGHHASIIGDIVLINTNIKTGNNVQIYPYVQIFGDGPIEIGDNVAIGTGTIIYASKTGGVKIGSNTMIAGQSYIIDADHGTERGKIIRDQINSVKPIEIGEDCWIGANVTVLKGSKIGNGAVLGAKCLVNGEILPYSINVGVPAKPIKFRV